MQKSIGKQLLLGLEAVEILLFSALAAYRILTYDTALQKLLAAGAAALYFAWIIWEMSHVTVRDLRRPAPPVQGKKSAMELAALAKILILGSSFGLTSSIDTTLAGFGLLIMLAGVGLRILAILTLGSAYSHQIALVPHEVLAKGPYRIIRHPAYLGTFIAHLGLVLVFCNPYSLASLVVWLIAVVQRTLSEEAYSSDNPAYRTYASRVRRRLLPFIW